MGSDLHMGGLPSNQYWKTSGNSGTDPNVNFIGTVDNIDLVFKTNNTERIEVTADGKVGINGTPAFFQFEVNGNMAAQKAENDVNAQFAQGFNTQTLFGENVYSSKFTTVDDNYSPAAPKVASVECNYSTDTNDAFVRLAYSQSTVLDLFVDVRESGVKIGNGFSTFIEMTPSGRVKLNLPSYADDAAADADATLPSGALYKVTGNRTIFQKP